GLLQRDRFRAGGAVADARDGAEGEDEERAGRRPHCEGLLPPNHDYSFPTFPDRPQPPTSAGAGRGSREGAWIPPVARARPDVRVFDENLPPGTFDCLRRDTPAPRRTPPSPADHDRGGKNRPGAVRPNGADHPLPFGPTAWVTPRRGTRTGGRRAVRGCRRAG